MMKIPVFYQYSYASLILHLAVLAGLAGWSMYGISSIGILLLVVYVVLYFLMKLLFLPAYLRGSRLLRSGNYEGAIDYFQQSYDCFEEKPWLDQYRYVILFNFSKMSYREIALCNIAFCYSQLGNAEKAVEYYRKTLEQFPDSVIANASLKLLNPLMEQIEKQKEHPYIED